MNRRQAIGLAVGAIVCPEQFVAPPNIDMDELGELMRADEYNGMAEAYARAVQTSVIYGTGAVLVSPREPLEARFVDPAEWYLP